MSEASERRTDSDSLRQEAGIPDVQTPDELVRRQPSPSAGQKARGRFGYLLRRAGPGLVAGASDDDPTNIGVYSQAGSQFGLSVLWLFMLTLPLMAAVQETCARIALQTGVGLGRSLARKFPRPLVGVLIAGLVAANCITLGADLSAVAAGSSLLIGQRVPPLWLVVPIALVLFVMQLLLTYEQITRTFKYLTIALFAYVAAAILLRPSPTELALATLIPRIEWNADYAMVVVAVLGTTISPYIFFWQASLLAEEKRRDVAAGDSTSRAAGWWRLIAARADVLTGIFVAQLTMYALVISAALVLHGHGKQDIQTADQAAQALAPLAGQFAFALFALGLIGSGLLTIPVLSASSAYVVGEFFDMSVTLGTRARYRPAFYAIVAGAVGFGVGMNFLRINVIKALVVSSVIEGLVAAPLLLLILFLGADSRVMGGRRSGALSKTLVGLATAAMTLSGSLFLVMLILGKAG